MSNPNDIGSRPESEAQLFHAATRLAGLCFKEVASQLNLRVPPNLKRDKGWVGMLLEAALGANAGSKAVQDFQHLGIELKTIPVDHNGQPLETTFVCVAPLTGNSGVTWQNSHVRQKLSRVLWIPIEGSRTIPLAERCIGSPLLWEPSKLEQQQLQADWEELMDMIVLGQVEKITAKIGEYLQIRPKAANANALTEAIGPQGQPIMTLPRGFYLKKKFTQALLAKHFVC